MIRTALLFFLVAMISASPKTDAADWPGWRGLEQQGYSRTATCPVTWSTNANISWRTTIPGHGHSSPVVAGDRVFVSTAYPATTGAQSRWTIVAIVLGIWGILAAYTLSGTIRNCRLPGGITTAEGAAAMLFLLLVGLVAAALIETHLGYCDDRKGLYFRWIHSGATFALCLALATITMAPRSRRRIITGVAALLVAAYIAAVRPDPSYYRLFDASKYSFLPTWIVVTTIVLTGAVLLFPALFQRKRPPGPAIDHTVVTTLFTRPVIKLAGALSIGILGFGILPFLGLKEMLWELGTSGGIKFPTDLDGMLAHFQYLFDYRYYGSHLTRAFVVCSFLVPLVASLAFTRKMNGIRCGVLFAPAIMVVGIMNFIAANYVGVRQELVRAIICMDRTTGATRWICSGLPGGESPAHPDNSPATPTPLIFGDRIVAWFGTPGMLCCDLDGKRLWTNTNLPYFDIHGVGASPVLAGGLIIIDSSMAGAPYLTALDPETGRRIWTTRFMPWTEGHGRHRTPTITTINNTPLILTWGWYQYGFAGHVARTGHQIFDIPFKFKGGGEAVNSMLTNGDTLFACSADGCQSRSLSQMMQGMEGLLWHTKLNGRGANTTSPVLCHGMLFMVSDQGHATCLDAKDGRILWQTRLPGNVWMTSPIAVGDKIFFSNSDGVTVVVAAEPLYRPLATNRLDAPLFASPAPADGQLFIRTTKHLWCIGR